MSLVVVAVGRIRTGGLRELLDDYARRVRRFTDFEECEVKDDLALERRFARSQRRVTLDVEGRALTSLQLSRQLVRWLEQGSKETAFFIGAAQGLPPGLRQHAEFSLSLSTLTLPHRLARLLLFEQLYRGLSLARGEPYARESSE